MPFRSPNPLLYPAGCLPRFNPRHLAARGIVRGHGFSGVALGTSFVSLLNGSAGTILGSPTAAVYNITGPSMGISTSNSTGCHFSGQSTANPTTVTMAAIFQIDAQAGAGYQGLFITSGTSGTGISLSLNNNKFNVSRGGVADNNSNIGTAIDTPYFFAASCSTGNTNINFLVLNLKTGAIQTHALVISGGVNTPDGTYGIGADGFNATAPTRGKIAAVMFSPTYFSMQHLLLWATDPWAFWYPRRILDRVGVAAAAGFHSRYYYDMGRAA